MSDSQKNGGAWLLIILLWMFLPFIGIPLLFWSYL